MQLQINYKAGASLSTKTANFLFGGFVGLFARNKIAVVGGLPMIRKVTVAASVSSYFKIRRLIIGAKNVYENLKCDAITRRYLCFFVGGESRR
jgi:hypothetical protein